MQDSLQDILEVIPGVAGIFGWGIFLAVAARFVFGTTRSDAVGWFYVGLAISVASTFLVAFADRRLDDPTSGESTMLLMGPVFSGGLTAC